MKSKGFTIAETLITLGIIGIIATVMMPTIGRLMPDNNKVKYLKAYDTISGVITKITSDSSLYPLCSSFFALPGGNTVRCEQYPLLNLDVANNFRGGAKLCNIIADWLNARNINCSDTAYAFNVADYTNQFLNPSFYLTNGMIWRIVPAIDASVVGNRGTFQTDIYIDVNGQNGPNCIYTENCPRPDIFKFMISASGKITAADPMGIEYLKTRKDFKMRDYDIENNNIENTVSDRTFAVGFCQ